MNLIKKLAGLLWIAIGLYAGYILIVTQAIEKFKSPKPEDLIPAIIYAFVLTPIIVGGLVTFGIYALQNQYDTTEE